MGVGDVGSLGAVRAGGARKKSQNRFTRYDIMTSNMTDPSIPNSTR